MDDLIPRENKMALKQSGWLGQSGRFYPMGTELKVIHDGEPASYWPIYEQVGEWYWNTTAKDWRVEWAD